MISKIKQAIALLCLNFSRCGPTRRKGALLLEIAIGLSVLGLVSTWFMTRWSASRRMIVEQRVHNNIEMTTSALISYVAVHKRLPRPSLPEDNGIESSDGSLIVGCVPFRTLGIPEKNSTDGIGRPLLYAVEPFLTGNYTRIYDSANYWDESCFCTSVVDSKIRIANEPRATRDSGDVIAFVLDTADNRPIVSEEGGVTVRPASHTFWLRRDMLLIHYLKNRPCENERNGDASIQNQHSVPPRTTTTTTEDNSDPFA